MCQSFESKGCVIHKRREPVPEMQKKQALGRLGVFMGGMGVFECASPLSPRAV